MQSCRFSTLLAHKPDRNEPESDLQKAERVRVHRMGRPYFLVVDNWERPFALPTSPFLDNFRVADHTLGIVEVHPRAIPGMRSGLVSIRYG